VKQEQLYIGLMSGTSMDGIDAVLVDLSAEQPELLNANTLPWPDTLRERLMRAAQGAPLNANQLAQLDAEAGQVFAQTALSVMPKKVPVQAIGSHGQTLAHNPNNKLGYSLQIGNPSLIAELTNTTTVADFRARDIAAQGQGAPLVPAFHQAIFYTAAENRIVLNIGGIANITHLPADAQQAVRGFDTGPGNCLMDAWIQQHKKQTFDRDGTFAQQGTANTQLLGRLLDDPYFKQTPPKSTGTDYFSLNWLTNKLGDSPLPITDVQATLVQLTSLSIKQGISLLDATVGRVLVCGGGCANPVLMDALQKTLTYPVESTQAYGLDPDWVEAVAFAWLAQRTLLNQTGNLPSVTGATGNRILGGIYLA
jgi:anhydro-N-acetylmuramic acid kinase